jgi:hypothetical protein
LTVPSTLEAGTTGQVVLSFLDAYDNPIPNQAGTLTLSDEGLGSLNSSNVTSDAVGVARVVYTADSAASGPLTITAVSGGFNTSSLMRVLGPPVTSLRFSGFASTTIKGYSIKPSDLIYLDAAYENVMTLQSIQYSIDGGPYQAYVGPFSITDVGAHTITHYGVTQGSLVHTETARRSLTIYVTDTSQEAFVNYPNPFRAGKEPTFLEYRLDNDSNVTFSVYDMLGQKVYERDILPGEMGGLSGLNRVEWDGRNSDGQTVANGGYLCILDLKADGKKLKRKIAVMK